MKKKTVKDEEGYLGSRYLLCFRLAFANVRTVTKEEPAWESFSEDEPAPKKPKVSTATLAAAKVKKTGGGKPGQGSIMSFFKKA